MVSSPKKESDKDKDLGEELADVLFVVVCLANQTGVDLQEAWDRRMAKKTSRDKDRHQNNENLGNMRKAFICLIITVLSVFVCWLKPDCIH